MKIAQALRRQIEESAKKAAREGRSANDACPYPFCSPEGLHFKAVHELHLPRNIAQPRCIPIPATNTNCPELKDTHHRAGSSAQREVPSRWGNELRYRDGTVTDLQGNLLRRRT